MMTDVAYSCIICIRVLYEAQLTCLTVLLTFLFSKVISVNEVNSLLIYDDLCD